LVTILFLLISRTFNLGKLIDILFKGMADLLPVGALLVLAITMGSICRQIGTGTYLADVIKHGLPAFMIPALVFGLSCVISFATGTCWGTLAIMVPIAMPVAAAAGISPSLIFGGCVGGGVFGNNCSPIADTSILTGMAAEINVIDHVKTQIPFALIVASISFVLYLISGII
jgi:Na+/H+ antiporter NhaC